MYWYTTEQGVRYRIYDDVHEFAATLPRFPSTYKSQYRKWVRTPAAFDIETTRIGKRAYMYHWQFSFGDAVILGRKWEEYEHLCYYLQNWLTKYDARMIVWVANLGHEFAFLCRRFEWGKVFAKSSHQPLTAEQGQLVYREALSLSGIGGLQQLAKQYTITKKAKGDLDYNKIRNSHTPLTPTETGYCIADVAILSEWGEYCFQRWIDPYRKWDKKIPLTATGICRQAVKDAAGDQLNEIKREARLSYPKTAKEYNFIMWRLFRGGYTHANVFWVDETVPDVIGADFTSSYPAVMLHPDKKYPIGRFFDIHLQTDGVHITDPKLDTLCCWMLVKFERIRSTTMHSIESMHKIIRHSGAREDNGRLMDADSITVALTEQDYKIYEMFYKWDKITVFYARGCKGGPLPKYITQPLLDAYTKKCELKRQHLDGTPEYQQAKAIVNSYYGMTVQRLSFVDYIWTPETDWDEHPTKRPYDDLLKDVFFSCYIGIWVTAHARYQLLAAVHMLDPDMRSFNVVYCDTDSIYMIASPDNIAAIQRYNEEIAKQNADLPECCDDLGCFDWIDNRAVYRFKTLGAKRYIKLTADGHATVTVAGMRKGTYEDSIADDEEPKEPYFTIQRDLHHDDGSVDVVTRYCTEYDFFEGFENHLLLSAYMSNKTTLLPTKHEYSDIVDGEEMHEMCGAAIYPIPFEIKMIDYYLDLIAEVKRTGRKPVYDADDERGGFEV